MARNVSQIRAAVRRHRSEGDSIALVPTMGALHAGHLSLVTAARQDCEVVVVSIFVNPLQFAPDEDLAAYPRTLAADLELLQEHGVEVVFQPDPNDFTPSDGLTTVHVDRLTAGLEASTRPAHFDGVTTIVTKLFNAVQPDRAYFGAKDFQQQAIIRRMVDDLSMPVQVVTCPLIREPDGLALSSRNAYLTGEQRRSALALSAALTRLRDFWDGDAESGRDLLVATLTAAPGVRLDYAEIIDPVTLHPLSGTVGGAAQAVVAAYVGTTRLIDNIALPQVELR
ncbi:MAG: pantoate--beta-alanine ligase [Euzebya sp.]